MTDGLRFLLDKQIKTASYSFTPAEAQTLPDPTNRTAPFKTFLLRYRRMIITLKVLSAARNTNETYDFYITAAPRAGGGAWDIVHFPQIATSGVKTFAAPVAAEVQVPTNVTTANPGVAATTSGCLQIDTPGAANGVKTLGAGIVRHGPWPDGIGYELVVAGTAPSISYEIWVEAA